MMSVAKSYEKYEIIGKPYEHDKRQYVKIKYPCCRKSFCSKCGGGGYYLKEVRWYDEPIIFDGHKGFGFFEAGYITLFKGNSSEIEEFCKEYLLRKARYNLLFSWYLPSSYTIPDNLPSSIIPIKLTWDEITFNNQLKDYDTIRNYVSGLINKSFCSQYVGVINGKIEKDFVVIEDTLNSGYYDDTHTYILEDEDGNRYIWKTAARKLEVEEIYHLKGTIKEHVKMEEIKYTVLTRCREG